MEKDSGRKKTNAKITWNLAGNHTVIPKDASPSHMPMQPDDRKMNLLREDGVPLQSMEDVLEAKKFVEENQK